MSGDELVIRPSRGDDIPTIAAIYAHHVLHGIGSFEEEPPSPGEMGRRRDEILLRSLPYMVAERGGRVVGYCYAGLFRPRSGYRFTLEDSVYIDPGEVGRGIGRALLEQVLGRCETLGYRQMVAVIGGRETLASIRLHEALGFAHIGILESVGFKFGRWIDIVLMQRSLGEGATTLPE
jgi:phosphinothricin acetyltransferase